MVVANTGSWLLPTPVHDYWWHRVMIVADAALLGKRLAAARVLGISVARGPALQLTRSSSACTPALLLYKCSSSALRGSSLLLIALVPLARTRYYYWHTAANFSPLATANFSSFCFFCIFVLYLNRLNTRIFSRYKCDHDTHTNGCETTNVIITYTYK